MKRLSLAILATTPILLFNGCAGVVSDDPMDLGTPAPCTSDEDCPEGVSCTFANETDESGFCDVEETDTTSGTPAPCTADEDCPEDIACIFPEGEDQSGFCDVEEQQRP